MFKPFHVVGVRQRFLLLEYCGLDSVLGTKWLYREVILAGDRVQKFSVCMAQSYKEREPPIENVSEIYETKKKKKT